MNETLAPINSLAVLEQACAELEMVVRYGLEDIKDGIDREHIATAHKLLGLLIAAQRAA